MGNDGGGAVGTGPGHTIGAALALKDSGRLTIGVIGDGDYLMGVNALWTAAHFDIPVMIVVADNRSYFNDEMHQERVAQMRSRPPQNRWIGQRIDNPRVDLVAMARAQGFDSEAPVSTAEACESAQKRRRDRRQRRPLFHRFAGAAGLCGQRPGSTGGCGKEIARPSPQQSKHLLTYVSMGTSRLSITHADGISLVHR